MSVRPARVAVRLLPTLLALLLLLPLLAPTVMPVAVAVPAPPIGPLPQANAPRPKAATEVPDSGSFHRAKVRILGIPVLTVASRVVSDSGGPTARQRAQVIEGNLEQLYRSQQVCTSSESIGEWIVEALAPHPRQRELACDTNQLGLLGQPEAVTVEVVNTGDGPPVLLARVPGRELPLPLLSVTDDDARLNGTSPQRLAQRWQALLQRRLRLARHLLEPAVLSKRLRTLALLQLVLLALLVGGLLLWRLVRRHLERLEERLAAGKDDGPPGDRWRQPLTLAGLHLLSRGLLAAMVLLAPLMAGVFVLAMPGQIPLAIDLLVQPFGILTKLLAGWLLAQFLNTVVGILLRQWRSNPRLTPESRLRFDQRYRSLRRASRRLVSLGCIVLVALWMLIEIPGVSDLSSHALLASGALLGALTLVFQDMLRDFASGLMVLLEDRYAIGDQLTIGAFSGDVVDVALLSTVLRGADQRLMVIPNSDCRQVINTTKLRSGCDLRLTLAHGNGDLRHALATLERAAAHFAADPAWRIDLLESPQLLGVREVSPRGLEVALTLVTQPGRQGPVGRELLLRLVEALRAERIPLAERP
ncbi:MAG: mechanosensitive ion channel family protein [Cyanobium sp.]